MSINFHASSLSLLSCKYVKYFCHDFPLFVQFESKHYSLVNMSGQEWGLFGTLGYLPIVHYPIMLMFVK